MAAKKVLLKNTELEACIKIVTDGTSTEPEIVTFQMHEFCFKPSSNTFKFTVDTANQFQQIGTKNPKLQLIHGQWSGISGDSHFRLYRGASTTDRSIDALVMTGCVGDTTQLEFDSQAYCADGELIENPLVFEITGEMTLWFKLRKRDFESFAGEYATYGAFEDDSKRGPYERYENI